MMGDDRGRIAAASKLAAKQIGCKIFKGSPYYRKEGVACPLQPNLSGSSVLQCFPATNRHQYIPHLCQLFAPGGSGF